MHWIDALAEMKENPGKVFKCLSIQFKFVNGELLQSAPDDLGWRKRMVAVFEQVEDWVEVSQWKKVDYAEFMEWYCNPVNKGKEYKGVYQANQESFSQRNNLDHTPRWFMYDVYNFEIPNE